MPAHPALANARSMKPSMVSLSHTVGSVAAIVPGVLMAEVGMILCMRER